MRPPFGAHGLKFFADGCGKISIEPSSGNVDDDFTGVDGPHQGRLGRILQGGWFPVERLEQRHIDLAAEDLDDLLLNLIQWSLGGADGLELYELQLLTWVKKTV